MDPERYLYISAFFYVVNLSVKVVEKNKTNKAVHSTGERHDKKRWKINDIDLTNTNTQSSENRF